MRAGLKIQGSKINELTTSVDRALKFPTALALAPRGYLTLLV